MKVHTQWRSLGWRNTFWELLRFYRSLRRGGDKWLEELVETNRVAGEDSDAFFVEPTDVELLEDYLGVSPTSFEEASNSLRSEEEAIAFCGTLGVTVGRTRTQSSDHHQSSKAMIGAVTEIARRVCDEFETSFNPDPQRRAVWWRDNGLHVSARNLDGAIPSLENPFLIWEIKEYWGKTKGGSKMSDAVYECHLVGRELRDFEDRSGFEVRHAVFLDGRDQWSYRKSDLRRFIDLFHQGLVDYLIVGRQVENEWERVLREVLGGQEQ